MRTFFATVIAVGVVACGRPFAVGADAPPAANTDQVLAQLDQVGKNLKEFRAKVRLAETDNFGGDVTHTGNAVYQKKSDGDVRMRITFDQRISSGKMSAEKKEYLLDGRFLIDRNYRMKNEAKIEQLKPGEKMDLFKLGQGPFPLPIGQDPAEVHRTFDVKSVPPAKDDPANSAHLQLVPKPGTDLSRNFRSMDVFVDQRTHMPVRVITEDVKGAKVSTADLGDVVVNPQGGLKDADFQLPSIEGQGWDRHVDGMQR